MTDARGPEAPATSDDEAPGAAIAERRIRRVPALVAGSPARPAPDERPAIDEAVALPPDDVASSAWYCAGGALVEREADDGTTVLAGRRENVTITNLGADPVEARVTVMAEASDPRSALVTIGPGATEQVRPSELHDAPVPGVVVEPFGGEVVVEQSTGAGDGLAIGPCATAPSSSWYLPAGTTVRGAEQWLSLFNPFGDDAIVDVTFATDEGRRDPDALSAYVVPRRSRVAIPVHDAVRRTAVVATTVVARTGRVVASQSLVLDTDDGRTGTTLSSGTTAPAARWVVAGAGVSDDGSWTISVLNPGTLDTEVVVSAVTEGDVAVEPVVLRIPRREVGVVDVGPAPEVDPDADPDAAPDGLEFEDAAVGRVRLPVPVGAAASVIVESGSGGVVVESTLARRGAGAAVSAGVALPAERWALARRSVTDVTAARLLVVNPESATAMVSVALVGPDGPTAPPGLQELVVPGGTRRNIDLDGSGAGGLLVTAEGPVVVERVLQRDEDVTRTPGVPDRDPRA